MEQQQTKTNSGYRERVDLDEPRRFRVILHNDDFTTMDFVVKVLRTVFFKSDIEAEALMLQVHNTGKAVVGVYPYDIAQSKKQKATAMARAEGFPLRITCQPEGE